MEVFKLIQTKIRFVINYNVSRFYVQFVKKKSSIFKLFRQSSLILVKLITINVEQYFTLVQKFYLRVAQYVHITCLNWR